MRRRVSPQDGKNSLRRANRTQYAHARINAKRRMAAAAESPVPHSAGYPCFTLFAGRTPCLDIDSGEGFGYRSENK